MTITNVANVANIATITRSVVLRLLERHDAQTEVNEGWRALGVALHSNQRNEALHGLKDRLVDLRRDMSPVGCNKGGEQAEALDPDHLVVAFHGQTQHLGEEGRDHRQVADQLEAQVFG